LNPDFGDVGRVGDSVVRYWEMLNEWRHEELKFLSKGVTSGAFDDSEDFEGVELVEGGAEDGGLMVKRTARVLEKSINISAIVSSPQKLDSILDTGNLTETIGQFQRD
jgi:hypothetical protein